MREYYILYHYKNNKGIMTSRVYCSTMEEVRENIEKHKNEESSIELTHWEIFKQIESGSVEVDE